MAGSWTQLCAVRSQRDGMGSSMELPAGSAPYGWFRRQAQRGPQRWMDGYYKCLRLGDNWGCPYDLRNTQAWSPPKVSPALVDVTSHPAPACAPNGITIHYLQQLGKCHARLANRTGRDSGHLLNGESSPTGSILQRAPLCKRFKISKKTSCSPQKTACNSKSATIDKTAG